jgi:hypothetical protein
LSAPEPIREALADHGFVRFEGQETRALLGPTDADWTVGPDDGPIVEGPGEALLLVATGRSDEQDVSGPGLALLR